MIQPIDGAYFHTMYFAVSVFCSLVVAFVGAYVMSEK